MSAWSPIRYAHNGDVSVAYTVGGAGEVDVLVIGGFVGHLGIGPTLPQMLERWGDPAGLELELRVGVNTGECERMADDLGGIGVHIAARVQAAAEPGQVLVSNTLKDLVVGSGLRFDDRGEHDLRGVPGPWRLHAVIGDAEQ